MTYLLLLMSLFLKPTLCDSAADEFQFRGTKTEMHQLEVCARVYWEANRQGVDPTWALATTQEETGFKDNLVSSKGAKGPMQVLGYWCKEDLDKCNKVEAGVRALRLLHTCKRIDWDKLECRSKLKTPKKWAVALCHYNSGNKCYESSRNYAGRVFNYRRRLKRRHGRRRE